MEPEKKRFNVKPMSVDVSADVHAALVELADRMSEDLGFAISPGQAVAWMLKNRPPMPAPMPVPAPIVVPAGNEPDVEFIGATIRTELIELLRQGQKIGAIKRLREYGGKTNSGDLLIGLKEAKEYVERLPVMP